MSVDDRIQAAEEKARRAQNYRDKLVVIKRAEAEIPSIWDTGQVTQSALATTYGISPMTVKRILQDAGRELHRFRKLNDEERAEVVAHLKNGETPDNLAAAYQVSRTTIRRVGVEAGVITKGSRKPRRSEEEYALILAFDEECRRRFNGAGLYNLGMGLRAWQQKQRALAAQLQEPSAPTSFVDGNLSEPEPALQVSPEPVPSPFDEAHKIASQPSAPAVQVRADEAPPVVFGDGVEDAAAVVGPFANQAEQKTGGFNI